MPIEHKVYYSGYMLNILILSLVLHLQVLHSSRESVSTLQLEFAGTNLGATGNPPSGHLYPLLIRQSAELGPVLGVVIFKLAIAAEPLVELLRRNVVAEVLVELEFVSGLALHCQWDFARIVGGETHTRGSMKGLMSLKKPQTNQGTVQRSAHWNARRGILTYG
jgi:hypothetical protein